MLAIWAGFFGGLYELGVYGGSMQGSLTKRGRVSTVDLLVLTSLEQLIFILKHNLPVSLNKLP